MGRTKKTSERIAGLLFAHGSAGWDDFVRDIDKILAPRMSEIWQAGAEAMREAMRKRGCPHACEVPCPHTRALDHLPTPPMPEGA